MLKLSIHMFIISTLVSSLTSVAVFAGGVEERDKRVKTAADIAIEESVKNAFLSHDLKDLEGDKMFTAARSVLGIKDNDSKKIDPELRKISVLDVTGQENL